ncbi:hypothetical protein AVEN_144653-1 [Araneus ventricosus]|uniref:Uncharacterized protein n=1 Tax=Araneus ventricosus TaxID=182803 RepID=A0A4Y2E0V7_ARAVE|nr:hypothetical protein AVEN_144653-1 [Araneus ventricosus]
MNSSFAYRQLNSNFTCGDPTVLPYTLIHSRNRGTVEHSVRVPRAWQVLDAYGSRLITTGIWCTVRDTALRTPLSSCEKIVKYAPSAGRNWITALCADLEESIMQRTAETTLQK